MANLPLGVIPISADEYDRLYPRYQLETKSGESFQTWLKRHRQQQTRRKLCHVIEWSWWWVTCPFWLGIVIWLLCLIAYTLLLAFESPEAKKRRQAKEAIEAMSKALRRS